MTTTTPLRQRPLNIPTDPALVAAQTQYEAVLHTYETQIAHWKALAESVAGLAYRVLVERRSLEAHRVEGLEASLPPGIEKELKDRYIQYCTEYQAVQAFAERLQQTPPPSPSREGSCKAMKADMVWLQESIGKYLGKVVDQMRQTGLQVEGTPASSATSRKRPASSSANGSAEAQDSSKLSKTAPGDKSVAAASASRAKASQYKLQLSIVPSSGESSPMAAAARPLRDPPQIQSQYNLPPDSLPTPLSSSQREGAQS